MKRKKILKSDSYKALLSLGLHDTTSDSQEKNGTIRMFDPIACCDYIYYRSGYSRRGYSIMGDDYRVYQLNKTVRIPKRGRTEVKRVLHPNNQEKLMVMSIPQIVSYRSKI